ncbi:MAG: transglutaminase family protein, partial [Chthoniobacterales bacterium]
SLTQLSSWHFENIQYERRDDGPARPAQETIALKSGACRDTAVLFAEILRAHGIPTRLVSGFLAKSVDDPAEHRADNALHAWVDAFLPGAGWVGFDPTNGVMCDHHYLATAVGPDMESIMPIKGNYFSDSNTPSRLDARVEVSVEV